MCPGMQVTVKMEGLVEFCQIFHTLPSLAIFAESASSPNLALSLGPLDQLIAFDCCTLNPPLSLG